MEPEVSAPRSDPAPVIWFEIRVDNLADAEAFYGPLLGWTFRPFEEYDAANYHIAVTREGTLGGALVHETGSEAVPTPATPQALIRLGTTIYAQVPDLDRALRQALDLGGTIVTAPRSIGAADGWFAMITDRAGNLVGLWSDRRPYAAP